MLPFSNLLQYGPAQTDWPFYGLIDDVRPALRAMFEAGQSGALVTLIGVDGPSPRGIGAHMLVDQTGRAAGYISGGCVEGSLALLAQEVIATGQAKSYVFGKNSPFKDISLICGSQIEVIIERAQPNDQSFQALLVASQNRRIFLRKTAPDQNDQTYLVSYQPSYRFVIVGHDPVALACCHLAKTMGFETILVRDKGPEQSMQGMADAYFRQPIGDALSTVQLDEWTAIVTTTHDLDQDHEALVLGLSSNAFYVGALGSKRRLDDRIAKLTTSGLSKDVISRLHAPVGLALGAATPFEIAISILADVIRARRLPPQ